MKNTLLNKQLRYFEPYKKYFEVNMINFYLTNTIMNRKIVQYCCVAVKKPEQTYYFLHHKKKIELEAS